MEVKKLCKHIFEVKTEKYEVWEKNYLCDNRYNYATLTQERTFIFCRNCGEYKKINLINNIT